MMIIQEKNVSFEIRDFELNKKGEKCVKYSDEEIVEIINEQLRVSDICVFSVPTPDFGKKMLGNERFMKRNKWREIINKSNAVIIKETGYHYKTFYNRFIDICKKTKRIFKPIALYVFVLKEKEEK